MSFSIKLSEKEKKLVTSYANRHSISLAQAFKTALFEKIEDEYDIKIADKVYAEYLKDGKKNRPIQELWDEVNL